MNESSAERPREKRGHSRSLTDELNRRRGHGSAPVLPLTYLPVPHPAAEAEARELPVWHVRLVLTSDPAAQLGLAINGAVVLGRTVHGESSGDVLDLTPYGGGARGVSRRHAEMRPTHTNLYVTDLGSTNGTQRNGRTIGVNTPYALVDGDTLALGRMRFIVYIDSRPALAEPPREQRIDLADALVEIAKAITSQLDLNEVLNQVASTARALTAAGETGIWLVDEQSGELMLQAERGMEDERIRRMRLPVDVASPMVEVLRTNRPLRVSRQPGEEEIKVKTGYLVEALAYVPISLGGATFGVLGAAHRKPGRQFNERDERLLQAIADFAAIAIQNARQYQTTDAALEMRVRELAALNELAATVSSSLDLAEVYRVLVTEIRQQWEVEAVALYLWEAADKRLHPYTGDGAGSAESFAASSSIDPLLRQVALNNQVLVSNDVPGHPDFDPGEKGVLPGAPRSLAAAPLTTRDGVVGVLALVDLRGGIFGEDDVTLLRAFSNPVATAVANARLFAESERQRAAIQATAHMLDQPLLILDEDGEVLVANERAEKVLQTHMAELFESVSSGVGRTVEVDAGSETYLMSSEHVGGVGTIIVMLDITYVKELEAARSELLHAISHDIKSPLTSIIGYTHVLERTTPLEGAGLYFLEQINLAANRILDMIGQLLETVDDASFMERQALPVSLVELVNRLVKDVEGATVKRQLTLEFVQSGQPTLFLGDERRLYHALLNIIDNAIKYTHAESTVTIRLDFGEGPADDILLAVEDEGPGIADEDLPHVFERYFRGGRTAQQPGHGVGLYLVQGTIHGHGGEIAAANRPEGGAVFTVRLPASIRLPVEIGQDASFGAKP
ncbi:MAG: GAF domain-containing protein [Anaerolineae bacterium]|nr:GAF domain-containing protein [Anaerolineae bacterium]